MSFGSYKELAECTEVDAVYIATLHPAHKDQAVTTPMATIKCSPLYQIMCLSHKKHVLCEKPMTLNAADADEVFAAAK